MNLNALPSHSMTTISGGWLEHEDITAAVTAHPLGVSLWSELRRAHDRLVHQRNRRMAMQAELAGLIARITELCATHNRKARSLRNLITDLAEATDDPALGEFLASLDALLFPQRLRIVHMSYFEQAGAVLDLEQRMTPEILRRLETIHVADQSLADIYRAWVWAGTELGRLVQERARLEASLRRSGSAAPSTHARAARSTWIRRVTLFLDALDILELPDRVEEALLAPLEVGIAQALGRRARASEDTEPAVEPDIEPDREPDREQVAGPGIESSTAPLVAPDTAPDKDPPRIEPRGPAGERPGPGSMMTAGPAPGSISPSVEHPATRGGPPLPPRLAADDTIQVTHAQALMRDRGAALREPEGVIG